MGNSRAKSKPRFSAPSEPEMEYSYSERSPMRLAPYSADHQYLMGDKNGVALPSPPNNTTSIKEDGNGNIFKDFRYKTFKPSWEEVMKTIPTRGLLSRRRRK